VGAPRLTGSGLQLGERLVPLLSGAAHYFRLEPARWRNALESIRGLGLHFVETYVPWGVHELGEGRHDFGEHDRHKNLGGFLDLAHELGLLVFLRPGPNVNAELPYFGLPRRIVMDERNQARSSRGNPLPLVVPPRMFPVPSYASRNFRAEVGRWFQVVGEIAGPRRWPRGPVALLQVDNEVAFYFRDSPYDSDYHPDALADFARFLARRHGSLAALNAAYGSSYEDFAHVPAPSCLQPRAPRSLPPVLDWMRFHEALQCEAIADMAKKLAGTGLGGLPMVHNLPMGEGGLPSSLTALGRAVDLVGLDYYHRRSASRTVGRRTLRLAGNSPLPFAPELGVGAPPWFAPRSDLDSLLGAMWACAYGLRGFNLYMAVEREQWYGAPIDADGEPRAHAEHWRRFIAALEEVGFHALTRKVEVALSVPAEYAQLSRATHTLGALSPSLLALSGLPASAASRADRFGFEQPIQLSWEPLLERCEEALSAAHVPYVCVDGERDLAACAGLRAVIAPSFEFADPERWRRLAQFAERGGTVLWGPALPHLDLDLQPHAFPEIGGRGASHVRDAADADALVQGLCEQLQLPRPFPVSPRTLRSTVHEDARGPRVVFVLNGGDSAEHAELSLPGKLALRDAMSGERFEGAESITMPVPAWGCRMLIVERGPRDQ
jgi:beta-galactosidase